MDFPIKLAEFDSKMEAHLKLEQVLEVGLYPMAECREDPNAHQQQAKPFQVWSAPRPESH